ncbi:hypothetical protein F3Y22_tig00110865pilonHSYRG00168 [Hibiscus syriacus]|uniref:Reverse transcriptase zinc-binding domain-containing protein n=1 Tax=Hibiscus syriacus TaxID=106335 RepID=A0A6A2ZL35_HIBSY|nr:hypothetical protein F3Y22_tig00110865pilonHSYRG00168 [Hibiscus syriacus]
MPCNVANELNKCIARFDWDLSNGNGIYWIKWEQLCKPKNRGGLGFFDLKLRNRLLLNKWPWRFGREPENLWRRVIAEKYGYDHRALVPSAPIGRNKSWIWSNITRPLSQPDDPFSDHLRVVLGDGNSIDFWNDSWTDCKSLKMAFPRIYAVAVNKSRKVADFVTIIDGKWSWNIDLKRSLFEWENQIWVSFLETISNTSNISNSTYEIRWECSENDFYLPKSYYELVTSPGSVEDKIGSLFGLNSLPRKWKHLFGN